MVKWCSNCKYWRLGTASLDDNYCVLTGEWADYEGSCDKWCYCGDAQLTSVVYPKGNNRFVRF